MDGIIVRKPGFLTTVQDKGRFNRQWSGLSPAGAMDLHSMRIANILISNDMDEAVLEITVTGPELEFTSNQVISITGADISPMIDGVAAKLYCALQIKKGQRLCFGSLRSGCRAYIAFSGGLDVPLLWGSRSTLLRNSIGGVEGRQLKEGDFIGFRAASATLPNMSRRMIKPESFENHGVCLRVVMGPQADRFTERGIKSFLGRQGYTITEQCNRHGYRLKGEKVEHVTDGNIVSDGIAMGAIQIPTDGQPIIMLAERQSTGGYTKIGTVITVDLPKIAQCMPGSRVCFIPIGIQEAQDLLIAEHKALKDLERLMTARDVAETRFYRVIVNNREYVAEITEIK